MSNLGLRLAMEEQGITMLETKVGDRYVLEELNAGDYRLGGEQSGHIVLPVHCTTGDGTLTGLKLMARMAETGKSLAELASVMKVLPQVLINVPVENKSEIMGSAEVQAAIEAGDVVVNVRTLNFLDRGNIDGHSTRAAAAVLAVAEAGETDVYWNYRAVLMEEQEDIYNKWSNDDFANAAKHVGASDAVVDKIRSGENVDAANSLATANADKLNEETGSVSSPRVIRDGEDVVGEKGDINQWLKILLG